MLLYIAAALQPHCCVTMGGMGGGPCGCSGHSCRTQRTAFCNNRVRAPHIRHFVNRFSVIINRFALTFFRSSYFSKTFSVLFTANIGCIAKSCSSPSLPAACSQISDLLHHALHIQSAFCAKAIVVKNFDSKCAFYFLLCPFASGSEIPRRAVKRSRFWLRESQFLGVELVHKQSDLDSLTPVTAVTYH